MPRDAPFNLPCHLFRLSPPSSGANGRAGAPRRYVDALFNLRPRTALTAAAGLHLNGAEQLEVFLFAGTKAFNGDGREGVMGRRVALAPMREAPMMATGASCAVARSFP